MSTIEFSFGDLIDEAAERAGLDPATLNHRHLTSIQRSLLMILTDIERNGCTTEYRQQTLTVPLSAAYGAVQLPSNVIDVSGVSVIYSGNPVPLGRTTREDYQNLSYPTQQGTPSIFWLSKSKPAESIFLTQTLGAAYRPSLNFSDQRNTQNFFMFPAWPGGGATPGGEGPFLVLWPQNGLTDTQLTVTCLRQINMPAGLGDQMDASRPWVDTMCYGLAARLAEKWNEEREPGLTGKYQTQLRGYEADEDHGPVRIGYRSFGFSRARRH